jgi:hypothetical protein
MEGSGRKQKKNLTNGYSVERTAAHSMFLGKPLAVRLVPFENSYLALAVD